MGKKMNVKTARGNGEYVELSRVWVEENGSVGGIVKVYDTDAKKFEINRVNPKFDQEKLSKAAANFLKACEAAIVHTGEVDES
jgi:hypothetical protein